MVKPLVHILKCILLKNTSTRSTRSWIDVSLMFGGFLSSLFFLSGNFTGNVIGGLSGGASNLVGGLLFFVGLLGLYFVVGKRRGQPINLKK